jgi:surfactin synthase thioesterase subunit
MDSMTRVGLVAFKASPNATQRLIMFPFAGAGAGAYRSWAAEIPPSVQCLSVQLPGRENRFSLPAFTQLIHAADAVAQEIRRLSPRLPTVFFGHSMGALLAFEVAQRLRDEGVPQRLVVSGRPAPDRPPEREPVSALSDEAFVERLVRLNGTPREVLAEPELMALMLPVLRADFGMIDGYRYDTTTPALSCPIQACYGHQDPDLNADNMRAWQGMTQGAFDCALFEGDHFYINNHRKALLDVMQLHAAAASG